MIAVLLAPFVSGSTTCGQIKALYQGVDRDSTTQCCGNTLQTEVEYDLVPDVDAAVLVTAYRTGPYQFNGNAYADGMLRYIQHYNENNELTLRVLECETGYNEQKSTECYYTHANEVAAYIPLSTGSVYAMASQVLDVPMLASGYGSGASSNEYLQFTGPSYNDAIDAFLMRQTTGSRVGYMHLPLPYGLNEVEYFTTRAQRLGLNPVMFDMKLPAIWGGPPSNATEILLQGDAHNVDAFYMMPWGGIGEGWLDTAKGLGIPMSKFVSVWWGSYDVIHPRFAGVKIVDFVDPAKSPFSLDSLDVRQYLLYLKGVRDGMIFSQLVESAVTSPSFSSGGVNFTRPPLVTSTATNRVFSTGVTFDTQYFNMHGFSPSCHVGDDCSICSCTSTFMFQYNGTSLTKM